jgi:hypothetical protein
VITRRHIIFANIHVVGATGVYAEDRCTSPSIFVNPRMAALGVIVLKNSPGVLQCLSQGMCMPIITLVHLGPIQIAERLLVCTEIA